MNWYDRLLEQTTNESALEHSWKNLTHKIRVYKERFDIAKKDPNNPKQIIDDLYWEIEEMKGKRRALEEKLREQSKAHKKAANIHCIQRIRERFRNIPGLEENVYLAEEVYKEYNKSFAICIKELDTYSRTRGSSGNLIVMIIRPGVKAECQTIMLRGRNQPFSPEAFNVDYAVRYNQFLDDVTEYTSRQYNKKQKRFDNNTMQQKTEIH